ncbi:MAG TPA: formate dehydrogenase subunit gamma [Candidatus Acidoferrum sp.]|nr:formate dehydrogenase subunit gamma [Candidatus Acidoferrum sp.]
MSREPYLLPNGRVLRYSYAERLVHWLAGVSYVYLMLTGLAFWSPWLFWIAVVLGGTTVSRELHPWFGVAFVVAVLLMYRMWSSQMKETPADKEWWAAIEHYARNEDEKMPDVDRFNPGQKLLFWGFFWSGVLLLLSGLILWLPQYIPWSLRFLRYLAVIVHPVCALLTIGLFIVHVYMGSVIEPGAFHSMIRGTVSRAWADRLHHTWFQQLLRESESRK